MRSKHPITQNFAGCVATELPPHGSADWRVPSSVLALTTRVPALGSDLWLPDYRRLEARQKLAQVLGLDGIEVMHQVHGTAVARAPRLDGLPGDACWTDQANVPCAVLTADCLPVLFSSLDGNVLAAAHAGWRGLAAGVLERTLDALPGAAESFCAWLGPAIGQAAFEVGPEVRAAFVAVDRQAEAAFQPGVGDRLHADICLLAKQRLVRAGVRLDNIFGGGRCTVGDPQLHSHRRDGARAGRMLSLIVRRDGANNREA